MLFVQLLFVNALFATGAWLLLPEHPYYFCLLLALCVTLIYRLIKRISDQFESLRKMLEGGFLSLHDGDFSISLPPSENKRNNAIIQSFNQMTEKLRIEKQSLYQRELMLDKVVNASDTITLLVNHRHSVVFANVSAQHFFGTRTLVGMDWQTLIKEHKPAFAEHYHKNNAIIQLATDDKSDVIQSWHLSRHGLKLHGASHQLILLKPMTKELHEQELRTWKKVIRVINHELNNSIAPISSMCHSGMILAEKLEQPQLDRVFNTISSRVEKLSTFIKNYSQLARFSNPQKIAFDLMDSLKQLQSLYQVNVHADLDALPVEADVNQVEQLLINLAKNANQACPDSPCDLFVSCESNNIRLLIRDKGLGMPPAVMQKAFLPYFSTKAEGSGIGLSLCKEVVDAHQGSIELNNGAEHGLEVSVVLPIIRANN